VLLYVVEKDTDSANVPIVFKKGVYETKDNPKDPLKIAAPDANGSADDA